MNIDTDSEFLTKSIAKSLNFLKNVGVEHTNILMIISVLLVWAYFIYKGVEQGMSIPDEVGNFVEGIRLQDEWFSSVTSSGTGHLNKSLQLYESSGLIFSSISFLSCFFLTFFARNPFYLLYKNDTKKDDKELDGEINKEIKGEVKEKLGDLITEQIEKGAKQRIVEQTDDGLAKGIGRTLKVLIIRLRPVGLSISVLLISGITGIITTFFTNKLELSYIESLFPIACGLGTLLAYLLSLKFPPRLY